MDVKRNQHMKKKHENTSPLTAHRIADTPHTTTLNRQTAAARTHIKHN